MSTLAWYQVQPELPETCQSKGSDKKYILNITSEKLIKNISINTL